MMRPLKPGTALRDATHHNVPSPTPITYGFDGMPTIASPSSGSGGQSGDPSPQTPRSLLNGQSHPHFNPNPLHHNVNVNANMMLGSAYSMNSSVYNPLHLGTLASPGVGLHEFDDMKRALDLSSLPVNPMTGTIPTIDTHPASAPHTAAPAGTFLHDSVPPKKPRHSPMVSPRQPVSASAATFSSSGGFPSMASPMHFGAPLTPSMPGRSGDGSLTVPSTPIMGMMNNMMGYMGMQNFPTSPILSPSMNPNVMTGNYGPAAAAAAAAAAGNLTGRTVYVGNLPAEASVDELLNLVRFGPIESVRLLPERSCVFISFLDGSTAAGFHADAQVKKLALHGQELKIGWGKASHLSQQIQQEVQQNQATRNVFVGNLDESTTEQDLRDALSSFGPIDQVKIVRDKNIGFVHFLSISTAMQVVAELPSLSGWETKRVSYGKDRCAYVPKAQQAAVQLAQQQALAAVQAQHGQVPGSPFGAFSPMTPTFSNFSAPNTPGFGSPLFSSSGFGNATPGGSASNGPSAASYGTDPASQLGNRTIYLGNLMPGTTTEELCNNIRGGQLQQVKHLTDKNIAFITFVDPNCALNFYNHAVNTGLTINTRRLKVGWGKHSGSLSPALAQAIQSGTSRNVYIGQVPDFDTVTEAKLREDFGQYGEIEMVNFLKEKNAAFVNFTSIQSATAAIDGIKTNPAYSEMRISFGKDRCGNMPRQQNNTTNNANNNSGSNSRPAPARNGSQLSVKSNGSGKLPPPPLPVKQSNAEQGASATQEEVPSSANIKSEGMDEDLEPASFE